MKIFGITVAVLAATADANFGDAFGDAFGVAMKDIAKLGNVATTAVGGGKEMVESAKDIWNDDESWMGKSAELKKLWESKKEEWKETTPGLHHRGKRMGRGKGKGKGKGKGGHRGGRRGGRRGDKEKGGLFGRDGHGQRHPVHVDDDADTDIDTATDTDNDSATDTDTDAETDTEPETKKLVLGRDGRGQRQPPADMDTKKMVLGQDGHGQRRPPTERFPSTKDTRPAHERPQDRRTERREKRKMKRRDGRGQKRRQERNDRREKEHEERVQGRRQERRHERGEHRHERGDKPKGKGKERFGRPGHGTRSARATLFGRPGHGRPTLPADTTDTTMPKVEDTPVM